MLLNGQLGPQDTNALENQNLHMKNQRRGPAQALKVRLHDTYGKDLSVAIRLTDAFRNPSLTFSEISNEQRIKRAIEQRQNRKRKAEEKLAAAKAPHNE